MEGFYFYGEEYSREGKNIKKTLDKANFSCYYTGEESKGASIDKSTSSRTIQIRIPTSIQGQQQNNHPMCME